MKKFNFNLIILIIISIVCGFLSGIIGLFLVTSGSIPFLSNYQISPNDADRQIVIDQPRNVIVSQDVQVKQLENNLMPSLINIYLKGKSAKGLIDSQILGQGLVLTSDGWILTTQNAISNVSLAYDAVGYQNKEYKLKDFIKDEKTGLVFGKMDGKNLPVVALGKSSELVLGQSVAVLSQRKKIEIAHITEIGYYFALEKDIVQSSDDFGKSLKLSIPLNDSYNGSIISTLKGEVVGMVVNGKVVMADYFRRTINDVLSTKKISRPELGINYIDLSNTEGVYSLGVQGAYVTEVLKTSAAFGKVKAGDVIKKINDFELNSFNSLSEVINQYNTGNKIEILFSRAGKDQSVQVILK